MIKLRGRAASDAVGFPPSHADAFQLVADSQRCIIMSRAVGEACQQLIEEGYSSKGFHIKAKSCDWGPMAGFVLEDPNLTKRAPDEAVKQAGDLKAAYGHGATSTPLYISDARLGWLLQRGMISKMGGSDGHMVVRAQQTDDDTYAVLRKYHFRLVKVSGKELPENPVAPVMHAVHYLDPSRAHHTESGIDPGTQVRAMVNPAGLGGRVPGCRAAVTGDYDLFGVWVHKDLYRPDRSGNGSNGVNDVRMVPVRTLEANIGAKLKDVGEDAHLGNMTGRLHKIRDLLNTAVQRAGYAGGNMVHHSDEQGRPFVEDVDLPVFAVVPSETRCFCLESVEDLREFINLYATPGGYVQMFNPGWMSHLMFGKPGVASMIKNFGPGFGPKG